MHSHFCTCPSTSCDKHPAFHGEGCDLCVQKNLQRGEIPACFWVLVGGDISGEKSFTVASFVEFVQRHRQGDVEIPSRGE